MPPRQPLPTAPTESPQYDSLPEEVLISVLARVVGADPQAPLEGSRMLADSRFSSLSRACRTASNGFLNQNAQMCYATSAERLKHAARQPGPWRERMAAAVRDLDHVSLQLHHIQCPLHVDANRQQLDDALSVLREHPRLRGLAITRSSWWWHPVDPQLAEILQVHKDSLKDLSLDLPLEFSTGLTEAFAGLGGLESLSLNNHSLDNQNNFSLADANSARRLADALGSLRKLRSLSLGGFSDAAVLTACLPRLPHLESLRISNCEDGPEALHAIASNLQGLQAAGRAPLRRLALCADLAEDVDFAPLLEPLVSGMGGLHELVLSGYRFCAVGVAVLAAGLQDMGELKILDLSDNNMNASGIGPLARALEKLPQLEELNLRDLGWAFQSVGLLAAKLKRCPRLKTLVLTGNSVQMPGVAQALAAGLAGLPQLETCHLPELDQDGLRELLPALQALQGCSLRKVVLDPENPDLVDELRSNLPGVQVS
jgi:hypothetical protein